MVRWRKFCKVRVAVGKDTEKAHAAAGVDVFRYVDDPGRPLHKPLPLGVREDRVPFVRSLRRFDRLP